MSMAVGGSFDFSEISQGARVATTLVVSSIVSNEVAKAAHYVFQCGWYDRFAAAFTSYIAAALISAHAVGLSLDRVFTIHAVYVALLLTYQHFCGA